MGAGEAKENRDARWETGQTVARRCSVSAEQSDEKNKVRSIMADSVCLALSAF